VRSGINADKPTLLGYDPAMAKLLLNLRNVPDDEADDVRAMLKEHGIEFYETRPSMWGVSGGGIWLKQNADFAEASRLMKDYQERRRSRARAEYEAAKRQGRVPTLGTVLRENPMLFLATVVGIVLVLALMALPFLFLLRG
jgi:hypothetical protein